MSNKSWKNWYVRDENGYLEMEIAPSKREGTIFVHFPKAEMFPEETPLLSVRSTFHEMRLYDFGYMLMAYSETEFRRFNEFYKGVMEDGEAELQTDLCNESKTGTPDKSNLPKHNK